MSSNAPSIEQAVEAARLAGLLPTAEEDAQNAAAIKQRQIERDVAEAVLAAEQAVEDGAYTPAQIAAALYAQADANIKAGNGDSRAALAHGEFVRRWQERERAERVDEQVWELAVASADEYTEHVGKVNALERQRLESELQAARAAQEQQRIAEAEAALRAHGVTLDPNTLAAHVARNPDLEPHDLARRTAYEVRVSDQEDAAIRSQVEQEWRNLRRDKGARSNLVTAADIARAEQAYKSERTAQIKAARAEATQAAALALPPTAEDEQRAQSDRIAARNDRSQSFADHVGEIDKRAHDAKVTRDRGEGIAEEKRAYREALARAEANAEVVTEGSIPSGYRGPGAEPRQKKGYGPDGSWPDEMGPTF